MCLLIHCISTNNQATTNASLLATAHIHREAMIQPVVGILSSARQQHRMVSLNGVVGWSAATVQDTVRTGNTNILARTRTAWCILFHRASLVFYKSPI